MRAKMAIFRRAGMAIYCLAMFLAAKPSHAANPVFDNEYEIAIFCGGAALSALPVPSEAEEVTARERDAAMAYVRHWFTLAVERGKAMGLKDEAVLAELNRQNADLNGDFESGEAPFYDLVVCDAPKSDSLWLKVPDTLDTEESHQSRSGPISLDRIADDREIDTFHSMTGRLRREYAKADAKRAFIGDVRILGLQNALTAMAASENQEDAGAVSLSLARAFRQREIGIDALNIEHAIDAYNAASGQLNPTETDWGFARLGACFSYFTRAIGDRADNIELAIAACRDALTALDRPETRQQWGMPSLFWLAL